MKQLAIAVSLLIGAAAFAQVPARKSAPADADTLVTADQLKAILASVPASDNGKPGDVSTQLFPGVASCSFIRLSDPDLPHVHPVSEIYVVTAGSGTLETGGTMIGPFTNGGVHHQAGTTGGQNAQQASAQPTNPDHAGTRIEGGRSEEVGPGSVIMVPAGVNHHWTKINEPLVYLDIKFPATGGGGAAAK